MQMFAAAELSLICNRNVLTTIEVFWLLPLCCLSVQSICMYRRINGSLPFHSEFSWLIVPFGVILDDFNFKRSFPKQPVILNNHILMKMCVHSGAMSADTHSSPLWLVKVRTAHVCVNRGTWARALTRNVGLMGRRALRRRHVWDVMLSFQRSPPGVLLMHL